MSVSRPRSGERFTFTLKLAHRGVGNGAGVSPAPRFNKSLFGTVVCCDSVALHVCPYERRYVIN